MNFDFTALLAILAIVSGVIWGGYALYKKIKGKPDAEQEADDTTKEPILVEYSRFLFPVFFIVLVVRGFLVEPFQIPSGSMLPTLEPGDFILVNKFSYGLRFPIGYQKFLDLGSPERGDVVVFRYPRDPDTDYIKRVVGIPGDRIRYENKQLYINDKLVTAEHLHPYPKDMNMNELREKLGEIEHHILLGKNYTSIRPYTYDDVVVPEDAYFVLGDNRDNSGDSRFWGFVPDQNLKGRAFMIWFHKRQGEWPDQWSRIGTIIE